LKKSFGGKDPNNVEVKYKNQGQLRLTRKKPSPDYMQGGPDFSRQGDPGKLHKDMEGREKCVWLLRAVIKKRRLSETERGNFGRDLSLLMTHERKDREFWT